ncbi:MAG: aminotransferase class I/II-fold pyridoxal phosphate-dependent enzyme [Hyphomicrobiaceae bacterium]
MSGVSRAHLMSRVKSMMRGQAAAGFDAENRNGAGAAPAAEFRGRATNFSTLPGFDDLRTQRAVADRLGLDSPYFHVHQERAGARTVIDNREFLNFSSYDYLGLNGHPEVIAAAKAALDRYGVSASASRLVAGERPAHLSLERALADHYEADDCIVFVSGYVTNVSVISHLVGAQDLIIYDAQIHNSAVVGSLLSKACRRSFPHNDLDGLESILAACRNQYDRCLILVEGLYSMDGDCPDLARLVQIKNRYGAWLMVDEAHALGTLGATGRGIAEHAGVDPRQVDIWMGTLSKTLAGCGGYIAGCRDLIDYLKFSVGAFVYSVGLPPAIAAACETALSLLHAEPERVRRQQHNSRRFVDLAHARGLDTSNAAGTAVMPVIVKDSLAAVLLSQQLFRRGINVQPIIPPAVPAKASRLRFFITSEHSERDLSSTVDVLVEELEQLSIGKLFGTRLRPGSL